MLYPSTSLFPSTTLYPPALLNLSTTLRGTPTYTSGNAKFGSFGLSGGVITGQNVDNFLSSTGLNGGTLNGTGTIEAWVKSTNVTGRKVFLQHSGWWYLASDNGVLFLEWGWGTYTITGGPSIMDGNWHHIALVFNAGQPSIYVDGSRVSTSTNVSAASGDGSTSGVFGVGGFFTNTGFDWPGAVDEVRVSNVARYSGTSYTVPTAAFTRDASTVALYHLEGNGNDDPGVVANTITCALAGSGALSSTLTAPHVSISCSLSGSGSLTSAMHRSITSPLSGSGTLGSTFGRAIRADLSGSGTLSSSLHRYIQAGLSGSGTLSSTLSGASLGIQVSSVLSGRGSLVSSLSGQPMQLLSALAGEGVLYAELEYIIQPQPLADLPFGKLVRYTVNNAAVPVNPAEGSGSTPSVNATYIKGKNPEFALGENFTVDNGAVGTYTGEIVRLSLNKKSDVATISTDTLLTLTNVDMHLFPFMDTDPGLWTAARAIEYWTQQTGLFYDKVDGECAVYASGFGHPNGYAERAGNSHFYDKLTAGANSTVVLNDRSVTTFGAGSTAVMAQHEAVQTRVPVTVGANRKMVFSIGMGLRGSGRTASATYKLLDGLDQSYTVTVEATSEGAVTAKVNGAAAASITVPAGGNNRYPSSLQRWAETSRVVKLTAHEDDLAGNGNLIVNGPAKAIPATIPGTLWLTSLVHASTGGSGAEMLRWGTYLTVSKFHPLVLPRVQKALQQSKKPMGYVSGFTTNVWKSLNEFCSINRMDLTFANDCVVTGPRLDGFNGSVKFSDFEVTAERREKYRQVAVVNKQSRAVRDNTAVLWRADSVYQVAAREIFETTVQTDHSILSVVNPVAVTGIWPFPYTEGAGQYVVTGADGYIVSPQWWYDNGGKVEVSLTEKDGEIAIKITPPDIDTVRAPYRISEGEGDRPALYISGSGIINKPEELHINTGAKNAREGFDNVFESPFIATANDAFNTAARMVQTYSAAAAEVSFGATNDFDAPSVLGAYPSGVVFTDNERNFKITDASQTHSQVTGNAIPFTTLAAYKASFPEGATIRDEKARHFTRTIKHTNIKPLRSNDESA